MILRSTAFLLVCALVFSSLLVSAQTVVVSARLEARNADGTPIAAKYVYPTAELETTDTGNMHIGEVYRFEGASVIERKLGLVLDLTVTVKGAKVLYHGQAKSTQLSDVSETDCSFKSTEAYFQGNVADGESVALWLKGPADDFEAITLHFAIKEEVATSKEVEVETVAENSAGE